jgi:hypothetical protein
MEARIDCYPLSRSRFKWAANPLISLTRSPMSRILEEDIGVSVSDITNGLDLLLQAMLSLAYYQPIDVWKGDQDLILKLARKVPADFGESTYQAFKSALETGIIFPNRQLLARLVEGHVTRQTTRDRQLNATKDGLSGFVRGQGFKFLSNTPRTTTKGREVRAEEDGSATTIVREKETGKRIMLKPVSAETSRACATHLHYIHSARSDEVAAYGAFIEDYDFPFAWVSYSPIGARIERLIAGCVEPGPGPVLEMTRAWNTSWTPKNTLSVLFAYAHAQLQATFSEIPTAVITAINPNLGFTGMGFRGVDFDVVGLKPTKYTFLLQRGIPIYSLPHDIAALLRIQSNQLEDRTDVGYSEMPLRHTHLLMTLLRGSARARPLTPIFVVRSQDEEHQHGNGR